MSLLLSCLLGAAGSSLAGPGDGDPGVRATVELRDGSRVVGQLEQKTLPFHSDLLGNVRLSVARIRSVEWLGKEGLSAHLRAVNGDELQVTLDTPELQLKTGFGEVKLAPALMRRLQISTTGAPEDLRRGLVALWSGEGNARDSLGRHDGQMRFGAGFAPGKVGRAFHFATDRGRVHIPDSQDFAFDGSFTVAGWVYITELPGEGGNFCISMRGDNRPGLDTWSMILLPEAQLNFGVGSEDGEGSGVAVTAKASEWFHVAGVYDQEGKRVALYVDGKLAAEKETSVKPIRELDGSQEPGLGLGNVEGTFHVFPFRGLLDEWAIYSRALSGSDIQALVDLGNAGERIQPVPEAP